MGDVFMSLKEEITKAMQMLAEDERVIFLGQNVCYPGHVVYETLSGVPDEKKIELPVAEEMQMGISTGMAICGFVPVSIYPRIDFLVLAMNQLVNHLDKLHEMSQGQLQPKVIVRTMIGNTSPLHPGPQHSQRHVPALRLLLKHTKVYEIERAEDVLQTYEKALHQEGPVLVVEAAYR